METTSYEASVKTSLIIYLYKEKITGGIQRPECFLCYRTYDNPIRSNLR